jgi:hypothetical protein
MDIIIALAMGIGISAACGFRVFLPLLALSVTGNAGYVELPEAMSFLASTPAVIALGTAAAFEVGAYYIPFIDNLLDTIATPAAIIAGTLATTAFVGDLGPVLQWGVGLVAGGGTAGAIQLSTAAARGGSTVTTGGFGNFAVSTGEAVGATTFSLLAIFIPLLAVLLFLVLLFFIFRLFFGRRRPKTIPVAENGSPGVS